MNKDEKDHMKSIWGTLLLIVVACVLLAILVAIFQIYIWPLR